ncbi:MAG TPA: hypothetical protein VM076_03775 [Gemmatimonadaceae bacterium]|nr:hypothetical protein [Gemmatimonadaceae bacterium]
MRRSTVHRFAIRSFTVGCFVALTGRAATAQGVCKPPKSSNEAKLLAFFATPIAFTPGGQLDGLRAGQLRVGFDAAYVPSPSKSVQQPEACYGIKKTENTNLSPVFPRPRIAVGLPGGVTLEGSYLPPVTVADAEPNLGSVAVSRPFRIRGTDEQGSLGLLVRGHATFGRVRGSITCPEKNLQQQDPNAACYGDKQSHDTYKPNMVGGELALLKEAAGQRWGAYALSGVTLLRPRFQVGFQYLSGPFDDTKITVDLTRVALGTGAWYRVGKSVALTSEFYSVPTDATTFRVGGSYTLR